MAPVAILTKAALLVKLTLSVNFTNIVRATFSYASVFRSFSLVTVCYIVIFCQKEISKKAALKMLVKSITG